MWALGELLTQVGHSDIGPILRGHSIDAVLSSAVALGSSQSVNLQEQIPMPMLKFTLPDAQPIWINPDKVVAVQRIAAYPESLPEPGATIHGDGDIHWSVQESVEDVVAKIEQAKER